MQQNTDWNFTFVFFIGVLGLLVSIVLYFTNKNNSFSARLLAAYLFCISYVSIHSNLANIDFFISYPHLWRTAVFASLCVPALAFIYARSILQKQIILKKSDGLYFLPALLYTLNMAPFYLKSAAIKIKVIQDFIKDHSLIYLEPEGMLPNGWGIVIRLVYSLSLGILQFRLLFQNRKLIRAHGPPSKQNQDMLSWLTYFTSTLFLTFIILLIEALFHVSRYFELSRMINLTIAFNILFICCYLLLKPNILYGLSGWIQLEPGNPKKSSPRTSLSVEQLSQYRGQLESHFAENNTFIQPGYKIIDLSAELKIPTYQLSAFINQEYEKNFNELINDYRIKYLVNLLKNNPDYSQYTLEALGKMVGFNNRASFIEAVKKTTGQTPMDYFGRIKPANEA